MKRAAPGKKRSGTGRAEGHPGPARAALAVGFAFGVAFGLALGAVAYIMRLDEAPSGIFAHAIRLTGHPDVAEDLIWLSSGGFIGAMGAAYAAWRAGKRRVDRFGDEHILNRTFRVLDGGMAEGEGQELLHKEDSGSRDRS